MTNTEEIQTTPETSTEPTEPAAAAAPEPISPALAALFQEQESLKARLVDVKAKIKSYKKSPASGAKRGPKGPRTSRSMTLALVDYLRKRPDGATAAEAIDAVCAVHGSKPTSVRTLLAALSRKGTITQLGAKGSFRYTAPAVAA